MEDVRLIYDAHTGHSKGYGFVTFADKSVADLLKGYAQVEIMGKTIDIGAAAKVGPGVQTTTLA